VYNNTNKTEEKTLKIDELIKTSLCAHKEMKDDFTNCAEKRWQEKDIQHRRVLYQGQSLENVVANGQATIEIDKNVKKNCQSSLLIMANTNIENISPRPTCGVTINFLEQDLSAYNRVSVWVYIDAVGYHNFYFHFTFGNNGEEVLHAPSLLPNQWNHVIWEVGRIKRDKVKKIGITPSLMGCPPEAEPLLKVYIDEVAMEQVEADYDLGWELQDRIAYCHSGFFVDAEKIAVVEKTESNHFYIFDTNHKVVYTGNPQKVATDIGNFYLLDFSKLKEIGEYYLQIDSRYTKPFVIDQNPYSSSIWKSMNFLRLLRCGEDVSGVHSACHLNCRTAHQDGRSVPNFGGWHDAGDVSQFEICTAEMAHAIIELALKVKNKDQLLYERLLEEAKVGINWLLRTRFGDGSRVLGVSYRIWRDNVLTSDNQTIICGSAENGPFENFCAAAAEALAYTLFQEEDPVFADWCLRAAKADFSYGQKGYAEGSYTKRWGPSIVAQTSGDGALAAAELYAITKEEQYLTFGVTYANDVLACQQQEYPDWDKPLRGFFYEDPAHQYILAYEHRGHEQTPVQGLVRLCEVASENPNYLKWKQGLELYREYILATSDLVAPYNLLPGHVYDLNKININHFTIVPTIGSPERALAILESQIKTGIQLAEHVYLRKFPIAVTRRGFHATLLSKVKAVSLIAQLFSDEKLKQVAINQLEWILGKNPFASSGMYGEGYNYHPLYVAFSDQMVGALPVGIRTYEDFDAPYWPTINNAVYKEIWGHTTGKFLWVLVDLIK